MIRATCGIVVAMLASVLAQQPSITQDIKPANKGRGSYVDMECHVEFPRNNPDEWKVLWVRQRGSDGATTISINKKINLDYNPVTDGQIKYVVNRQLAEAGSNKYIYTLTIHNLIQTDTGIYDCQIFIPGQLQPVFKRANLKVSVPPRILPRSTGSVITVVNGSTEMVCIAEADPLAKITWIKATGESLKIPVQHEIKRKQLSENTVQSTLILRRVQNEDRGIYRCTANNDVPPFDTHDVVLSIEYQPTVRLSHPTVDAYLGQSRARVSCLVSGSPEPITDFYFIGNKLTDKEQFDPNRPRGTRLRTGVKYFITQSNKGPDLRAGELDHIAVIKDIQSSDFGFYACVGRNRHGSHANFVYLYRTDKTGFVDFARETLNEKDNGGSQALLSIHLLAISCILCLWRNYQ